MYKIKPFKITVGIIKDNFKGTIERFVANNKSFPLIVASKEHQHTGNSVYMMY